MTLITPSPHSNRPNRYLEKVAQLTDQEASAIKQGVVSGTLLGLVDKFLRTEKNRNYLEGAITGAGEGALGGLGLMYLFNKAPND